MSTRIVLEQYRRTKYLESKYLSKYSIDPESPTDLPVRPVGSLQIFRETTLSAGCSDVVVSEIPMQIFILPLVGKVDVESTHLHNSVDTEEAILVSIGAGEQLQLINNYSASNIHFLLAGFVSHEQIEGFTSFSLTSNLLRKLPLSWAREGLRQVSIGQFDGRYDSTYVPMSGCLTFAWVIQGAFELQNCLLEKSDGLVIKGEDSIEFEALSNDAILILFEFN